MYDRKGWRPGWRYLDPAKRLPLLRMRDEPRRHPGFMLLLALASLATVPVLFVGPFPRLWLGLPIWLWWSLGWTAALSGLTAWGLLRYWKDDDLE